MVAKERGEELQAARSLLGPKGGLPTLKADLLRLATLLHVDVGPTETVEKIKQKLRPMVSTLKGTSATGTSPENPNRTNLGYPIARLGQGPTNQAPGPRRPSCWLR